MAMQSLFKLCYPPQETAADRMFNNATADTILGQLVEAIMAKKSRGKLPATACGTAWKEDAKDEKVDSMKKSKAHRLRFS